MCPVVQLEGRIFCVMMSTTMKLASAHVQVTFWLLHPAPTCADWCCHLVPLTCSNMVVILRHLVPTLYLHSWWFLSACQSMLHGTRSSWSLAACDGVHFLPSTSANTLPALVAVTYLQQLALMVLFLVVLTHTLPDCSLHCVVVVV